MTDYFAHAAFGVQLDDVAIAQVEALLHRAYEHYESDEYEDEDSEDVPNSPGWAVDWVSKNCEKELNDIKRQLGLPLDVRLIYTGDEEEHAGGSATPPETWIFGYGVLSFPRHVPEYFRAKAQWFSWVTA